MQFSLLLPGQKLLSGVWCLPSAKLYPQCETFIVNCRACSAQADLVLLLIGKSKEQKHGSCRACGPRKIAAVLAAHFASLGDLLRRISWEFEKQSKELKPFKLSASTRFHVLGKTPLLQMVSQKSGVKTCPAENKAVSQSLPCFILYNCRLKMLYLYRNVECCALRVGCDPDLFHMVKIVLVELFELIFCILAWPAYI